MKRTSILVASLLGFGAVFVAFQGGALHLPLAGVDEFPSSSEKEEAPLAEQKEAASVDSKSDCPECLTTPGHGASSSSSSSVSSSSSSTDPTSAPVLTTPVPVLSTSGGGGLGIQFYSSLSSSSSSQEAHSTATPLTQSSSSSTSKEEESQVVEAVSPIQVLSPISPVFRILTDHSADVDPSTIASLGVHEYAETITVVSGFTLSLPSDPTAPVEAAQAFQMISALAGTEVGVPDIVHEGQSYPTRAAMIAAILEQFEVPLVKRRVPFKDVAPTNPHADAIATAKQLKLITGDTDENAVQLKTFRPNDPVSASEMNLIIRRLMRLGFAKKF